MDRDMEQRVWHALETAVRPDDIVVVSTHRPMLASRLVDRVLIMQRGRIVQDGSPETLLPRMVGRSSAPTPKDADNEQNNAL